MTKNYNGFPNKDTWDVVGCIMGDDDELTFYCTNTRLELACKLNQDYKPKFPLVDFIRVMEYFEGMQKYWRNYLTTDRRESLGLYGDSTIW
jgi:hypothetical protein